ncbi:MAG TPA: pyridoxal-phosphate dependent enzyme, partial [Paraburkholderia sp.]
MQVHQSRPAAEATETTRAAQSRHDENDYLRMILTARVYDAARETELERAPNLSARLRNAVFLKREDNQPVFSFKLRGAYNKMAHLTP